VISEIRVLFLRKVDRNVALNVDVIRGNRFNLIKLNVFVERTHLLFIAMSIAVHYFGCSQATERSHMV